MKMKLQALTVLANYSLRHFFFVRLRPLFGNLTEIYQIVLNDLHQESKSSHSNDKKNTKKYGIFLILNYASRKNGYHHKSKEIEISMTSFLGKRQLVLESYKRGRDHGMIFVKTIDFGLKSRILQNFCCC